MSKASAAQEAAPDGKQRAGKRRAPKARTPEPKEIISGAGHPLDPGVRRDLEARLGHDFSRIRVHSDRDAAALTELVGADAVTVGEDIFFAEGKFRPGTEDGRRLLAHELLHTVQAPHPLGALRAGRELGAVSLPQDAIEREAEQGARAPGREPAATPSATPGWLRYATVNAERYRTEKLDPATLVDRLAAGILRSLRGDPTDSSGRVRLQLVRFAPELQTAVLERLSDRMPSSDYARLLELLDVAEHDQAPDAVDAAPTPEPVTDVADQDQPEQQADQDAEPSGEQADHAKDRRKKHKGQGKDQENKDQGQPEQPAGAQDSQEPEGGQQAAARAAAAPAGPEQQAQPVPEQAPQADQAQADQPQPAVAEATAPEQAPATEAAAQPAAASAVGSPQQEQKEAGARPTPGTRPGAPDARQLPQPGPVKPERVDEIAQAKDSPLVQHGLLERDQRAEPRDEERPLDLEAGAEQEVEPHAEAEKQAPPADATPELKPEDFVPSTDLDVSGVPTADQITPPADGSAPAAAEAPTFPEPPETKAEQVQAARENEPQDETDPAPREPAAAAPQVAPEPTPADEAEDRTTRDLQPEQPVEQEIGPEPETSAQVPAASAPAAPAPVEQAEPEAPAAAEPAAATTEPGGPPEPAMAAEQAAPGAPGPVGGALDQAAPVTSTAADAATPAVPGPAAEQADAPGELGATPAPDASLEPGGGSCAGPQQPTTEEETADGGDGGPAPGGAGGETKQEDKPAAPDVSGQDPESALATAAGLPPDQMATTLDGVDGAVDRTVGEQHAQLQSAPPSRERPVGAPQTQSGTPEAAAPAEAVSERLERVGPDGTTQGDQRPDAKKAEGANPTDQVAQPNVADDGANQVSAQEAQQVQGAVNDVPTTDPALNVAVPTPTVDLKGESDPARTDQQQGKLKERSGKILTVGRDDAAKPMGEDRIYPHVPKETLTATVPGAAGGRGGSARGAVDTKPGIGIVTQQERGPQIQAAVGQGQGQLASEQAKQKQGEAEQRRQNQAEIDQSVADNAQAQAGERGAAADQVKTEREQWRTEQDQKISDADQNADSEHKDKNDQIGKKRTDTQKDIKDRQDTDNAQIQKNRQEAEDKARKKKEEKQEESSGWWGWVKSKVKQAFNALLDAVTGIFDYFRNLINGIIDAFKKFADSVIDAVRNFAIDLINKLADALIAICDVLLAAFPELRDKFRKKIEEWRDKAIAKVNELADKLKAAVNKLLDALAAGLNALLNALEAGLKAAIERVRKAVLDAIDFVQKAIAMFGEFAALVGDIAPDPGGWLKKLGQAAMDGIQHYLWGAIKSAVKQWFNDKVESVVGLTSSLINILIKGCISMAQIGRMAWQAVVAALPGMIISLVIEKLVSMIVPAAGAIMTIIQGLMAAWNTISKIIAAIGKFVSFLKAVKSGGAAPLFAQAVASGVVALLDFITNFLLSRLKGAAKGVGTKLKGIAQKILKGLAKAGKGARKFAGRAVNKARATIRKASSALRRRPSTTPARPTRTGPARHTLRRAEPTNRHETTHPKTTRPQRPKSPVGRVLSNARQTVKAATTRIRQAARTLGRKLLNSKLGRALTNGAHRLRDAYRRQRDHLRDWRQKRQQQRADRRKRANSPEAKQQRLDQIVARLQPRLERLLGKGIRRQVLSAVLVGLRTWYRLTGLELTGVADFVIRALLNPEKVTVAGVELDRNELLKHIRKEADRVQGTPRLARQSNEIGYDQDNKRLSLGDTVNSASLAAKLRKLSFSDGSSQTIEGPNGSTAGLKQGFNSPRNQVVSPRGSADERLPHDYASMFADMSPAERQNVAQTLLHDLEGKTPAAGEGGIPDNQRLFLHTLGAVEENRSPSDLVYRAMAYDAAIKDSSKFETDEKKGALGDLHSAVNKLPLAPKGAQSEARQLNLAFAFQKLSSGTSDPKAVARRMAALADQEGLKPAELQKMTGVSQARFLTSQGISAKDRKKTRSIVNDKNATPEARAAAAATVASWNADYAKHAWADAAAKGELKTTKQANAMADREIEFLQAWAVTLRLDFSKGSAEAGKKALFDHISAEINRIYGLKQS